MLGELISEETGKITSVRVLPSDGNNPNIEVSYQSKGKVLGIETTNMGTYCSVLRSGGILHGGGQGVLITKDGEAITWTAQGIGKPTGQGQATSYRGAVFFQTSSSKLDRLNRMACVFEHETDENNNVRSEIWEWK